MKVQSWKFKVESFLLLSLLLALPAFALDRQLAPSSRRTPLIISEIMYHPAAALGVNGEFVELFNTEPVPQDLGGFHLGGDVGYTFPTGAVIPALGYVVIAASPATIASAYGLTNAAGPFTNQLSNAGGRVFLENRWGARLLDITYDDTPPWPIAADGAGHSLVLARPDLGESDPLAWSPSTSPGGSPNTLDPHDNSALRAVVINEFLAHTDPDLDMLELYNASTQSVDIAGCAICDEPDAECFTIPPATVLAPGGFTNYTELDLGYRFSASGDDLFLMAPGGSNVLDAALFEAQERGVSSGRYPDGAPDIGRLAAHTPGASNAPPRQESIVISEIMFHPLSGRDNDEFIELYNRGTNTVNLTGWQFSDGIKFIIPSGTTLAPGARLVIASDRDRLISRYLQLNTANTLGNFSGDLSDRGERLTLSKPDNPAFPLQDFVVIDEVSYGDDEDWGEWIDGGGSSLELTDPHADNRRAANWAGSDETQKALWTTIEYTGKVDNGSGTNNELDVYMLNDGECLVDNIELTKQGETNNRVAPSLFTTTLDGWTPLGNHVRSAREAGVGDGGGAALHVRASSAGRTTTTSYLLGNFDRIWKPIAPVPVTGDVYTVRFRARWLAGWPFVATSMKGFWIEAAGAMHTPENAGTPGLANSRAVTNAPPAVWDLAHTPVLPAAGEPVTVSCRADDPNGLAALDLHYRLDPTNVYTSLPLTREPPGGTGRWRAVIPGQTNGAMVGFYVTARDDAAIPAERDFPSGDLTQNALVRFGDVLTNSVFGSYAYWVSDANVKALASRSPQANEPVDGTFVYNGGTRVIYNALLRYRGNFRHSFNITNAAYALDYPRGNTFLGDRESKLDIPSLQFPNGTLQQERHSYWMSERIGHPASYLRYARVTVNGANLFRHDLQAPTRDFADSWYGDGDAHIFKEDKPLDPFGVYNTTGGLKKHPPYRFIMQKNGTTLPDDDHQALYRVADALALTNTATYTARVDAMTDARSWASYFAINHAAGNEDSYGYGASFLHNMYAYMPPTGRSRLHLYDMDSAFTTDLLPLLPDANYPIMQRLYRNPAFERVYWRVLQELAADPMTPTNSDARLDAWYNALLADGITVNSASVVDPNTGKTMRQWIVDRRADILTGLTATNASVAFAFTSNGGADFSTSNRIVTLTGMAPVAAEQLRINGNPLNATWLTPITWQTRLGLEPGTNIFSCDALDRFGAVLGSDTITVTYTGAAASPKGSVVLNELMYHPPGAGASFIELFNASFSNAFELGGCTFEGVNCTVPRGSVIAPRGFLVVAESLPGYAAAYTNAEVLAGEYGGSLANEGERISLRLPASLGGDVLDEVFYTSGFPWPDDAAGRGSSLQRVDPAQDGRHPGAWRAADLDANRQWTFVSVTGLTGSSVPATGAAAVQLYVQSTGTVPVDNVSLVAGAVAETGTNRITNGQFESGLLTPWTAIGNHARSSVSATQPYAGTNGLLVTGTGKGLGGTHNVRQSGLGLSVSSTYTLSYWYYPVDGVDGLSVEISATSIRTNHAVSPPLPAQASTTPGFTNSVSTNLPALPNLWINEIGPTPSPSIVDNLNEPAPWIEIWNGATSQVDLTGIFLGNTSTAPLGWAFPTGTLLAASSHLLIWADAETNETVPSALHAGLTLSPTGGVVILSLQHNGQPLILDALPYATVAAGTSFGSTDESDPFIRQIFSTPTPGIANDTAGAMLPIRINEWMADNAYFPDPADSRNQDWFELFNPNTYPVSLSGYRLTDNLSANPFVVPGGTWIGPQNFLLVWADNETGQNAPGGNLHANFSLNKNGESIFISEAGGTLVDQTTFGPQSENISEGRWPDGNDSIFVMHGPTPDASNHVLLVAATSLTNGAGFVVNWAALPGTIYQLDAIGDLRTTNWLPVGVVTATSASASYTDTTAGSSTQRFYRIRTP